MTMNLLNEMCHQAAYRATVARTTRPAHTPWGPKSAAQELLSMIDRQISAIPTGTKPLTLLQLGRMRAKARFTLATYVEIISDTKA